MPASVTDVSRSHGFQIPLTSLNHIPNTYTHLTHSNFGLNSPCLVRFNPFAIKKRSKQPAKSNTHGWPAQRSRVSALEARLTGLMRGSFSPMVPERGKCRGNALVCMQGGRGWYVQVDARMSRIYTVRTSKRYMTYEIWS